MGSITGYLPCSASSIERGKSTSTSLHISNIADAAYVAHRRNLKPIVCDRHRDGLLWNKTHYLMPIVMSLRRL